MKRKPQLDPRDRETISMEDFGEAVGQLLNTPECDKKSENREPTKEELERRYKVSRR